MKTKLNVISAAIIGILMMTISGMPALAVSPEASEYALTKGYFYQFLSDAEKADYEQYARFRAGLERSSVPSLTPMTNAAYSSDHPILSLDSSLSPDPIFSKINELKAGVGGSLYDRALQMHDRLCQVATYDRKVPYGGMVYGAIVDGRAVCEGYSSAYQALCTSVGVDCLVVFGHVKTGLHAWNVVRLDDGNWYEVDCTWDDESDSFNHKYFALSTEAMGKTHSRGNTEPAKDILLPYIPSAAGGIYSGQAEIGDVISFKSGREVKINGPGTICLLKWKTNSAKKDGNYNANLTYIKINGEKYTITEIGDDAFKGDKGLSRVKIGKDVTKIGKNAFKGCKNLADIDIKSKKLKEIGSGAFKDISKKAVIKTPKSKRKGYKKLLKKAKTPSYVTIK